MDQRVNIASDFERIRVQKTPGPEPRQNRPGSALPNKQYLAYQEPASRVRHNYFRADS